MRNNQNGFGVPIFIFSALVITAIVIVGWVVLKQSINRSDTPNTSQNQPTSTHDTQTSVQYASYAKNPNFTVNYPEDWEVRVSGQDSCNQTIFFSTSDFAAEGSDGGFVPAEDSVLSESFSVKKGVQFYVNLSDLGRPQTLDQTLATMINDMKNTAPIYEQAYKRSFQLPKLAKTSKGIQYISFIGHSSLRTPVNNSSNALFVGTNCMFVLGYIYPTREDDLVDPSYAKEFAYFIESLIIK